MPTEKHTVDRRVVKTKRAIKNAFAKLLSEKDINDITISDIAAVADINRKTFYNYYAGVHEVIDEIEDDIIGHVDDALTEIDFKSSLESPYLIFEKLTNVINADMDFFGYLLSMNSNVSLTSKIADLLKNKCKVLIMRYIDIDEMRIDIMLEFMISAMVAVYRRWFNSDRSEPVEEISNQIKILAFQGLNGFLDIDFI
ncbi:MAG: TetR/AcrR family transcriptional regulator [Ruminococcus sp.]|nr:TetR/AcrR family transcriptional regulator [Ruminococcus sp.]